MTLQNIVPKCIPSTPIALPSTKPSLKNIAPEIKMPVGSQDIIDIENPVKSPKRDKTAIHSITDKVHSIEKLPDGTYQVKPEKNSNTIFSAPKIENVNGMVRIEQALENEINMSELDKLVADNVIKSYSKENNQLVIFADSNEAVDKLKTLKTEGASTKTGGIFSKVKEIFIPPNLEENCAPEYLRHRAWSLGAITFGNAIGFMNTRANLDAIKIAFNSTENVALAGVVNDVLAKLTSVTASFLASKGDQNPKKFFLGSNLIYMTNSFVALTGLSLLPELYVPLQATIAVSGALATALGASTWMHVFNHLAKGPAKGLIQSKNNNQETVANLLGMPIAMGLTRIAQSLGVNPYIFTLLTAGVMHSFCSLKSMNAMQCESLGKANLEKVVNYFIENEDLPQSEKTSVLQMLKDLFKGENTDYSKRIKFAESMNEVTGAGDTANLEKNQTDEKQPDNANQNAPISIQPAPADELYSIFKDDTYLLNLKEDNSINIAFKKKTNYDSIFKAYTHGKLVELGIDSGLIEKLNRICGKNSSSALIDLAYRAIPDDMAVTFKLNDKGWFPSVSILGVKTLDINWKGSEKTTAPQLDMKKFRELAGSDNLEEIKKFVRKEYLTENCQ